jgi:hypothetical protein
MIFDQKQLSGFYKDNFRIIPTRFRVGLDGIEKAINY